ncbi:unnamed protein product, partial [Polarella glacialis]
RECPKATSGTSIGSNYVSFGYGAYILDELPPPLVDDDSDSEGPPPLVSDTESEDERPPRDNHEMMDDTVDEFVSVLMARFPAQRPTQPYLPTTPGFGVTDSGCGYTMVGRETFLNYEEHLRSARHL